MQERLTGPASRGGEAAYFIAFNATNALNYAYLVSMGLLLGTESYGLFGALFGVVYLASALGNTVQVAVARQIAFFEGNPGRALTQGVLVWALAPAGALAAVVGLTALLLSPALAQAFNSPLTPLGWTSLAVALSIWVPAGYGVLQGTQRFAPLGASLLAAALSRMAIGAALVTAGWGASGALAGVAFGYAASGLLALVWAVPEKGHSLRPRLTAPSASSLAAILVASLAVAAPTSLDVALVKHFFSDHEAGMYTAVAVLGRVVLFVPLAISFIALPKVAKRVSRGDNPVPLLWSSLAQTAVLAGGTALLLVLLTSGFGWSPVGADISGAMTSLYWYLPAMVAFALVVALVYYQIGRGNNSYVFALFVPGIAAQAALILLFHDSLTVVAQVMFVVNVLLLVASLFLVALPRLRSIFLARSLSRQTIADAWSLHLPPSD